MCFVERAGSAAPPADSAAPPAKRPRCSAAAPFAEAARWEQVTAANWESFLLRVPPDAEGCVLYAREACLLVKLKRTSGVQTMARASTVLTHYSSQEIRATFACAGVVMNKNLMFRARPPATLACEGDLLHKRTKPFTPPLPSSFPPRALSLWLNRVKDSTNLYTLPLPSPSPLRANSNPYTPPLPSLSDHLSAHTLNPLLPP
jgi:hypothetical protein